jgi:hypothetical protein
LEDLDTDGRIILEMDLQQVGLGDIDYTDVIQDSER